MSYKIIYTKSAVKDIKKLDKVIQKKLKIKIESLILDPIGNSKKLINSSIGEYRWRIGNIRVVFDYDSEKELVVVLRVRHRRDVYSINVM